MGRLLKALVLMIAALPVYGQQTLRDTLQGAGIPSHGFTPAELAQRVNAASANNEGKTYLAYFTLDAPDEPRFVRYDAKTGESLRKNLKPGEAEDCCGTTPLEFTFTRHYMLASFHINPSASVVIATDKLLNYRATLFGYDFHEFAPDRVVYVEDQVHFAPAHPGRVAFADLTTGEKQELYPSRNDRLRTAFAELHKQHMPPQADCQQANDPCDSGYYDEDIDFGDGRPGGFQIRVTRRAEHRWVTQDMVVDVPFQMATYTYRQTAAGWMYCAIEDSVATLIKSIDDTVPGSKTKSCEPSLPVTPETPGMFSPQAQEKR